MIFQIWIGFAYPSWSRRDSNPGPSEPEFVIQFLWVSLCLWASSAFLKNAFAPILRRFGIVNTLLSVAKVRESEQKAKIIMDFFEWECFEWAQIWKIVQSIWKIFHKIFTFLDKNPIIALSEHWCQSELRIKGRCDWGSTSVHSNGNLQQISLAKGQWSDVILLQL